ncbi:MAG: ribosome-binding factor A [Candidatus Paceibacterota bacterium]|jgi:ribosome-binding factor A
MKPFRNLKAGSLIEEELGKILTRDYNFEGALVTITDVLVDEKLLHATIKIGIIPFAKSAIAYRILTSSASGLRQKLLKKMNIKPMPFLKFEIDTTGMTEQEKKGTLMPEEEITQ